MKIYIASSNKHKIHEITQVFQHDKSVVNIELHTISDMNIPEPDEPYDSFIENAIYKAKHYARYTKQPTLSEDSGLCIEVLDNFPGVKTKDFALECGSLQQSYVVLEQMLANKENYSAHFVCAAALYIPEQDRVLTAEGRVFGNLTFPARGDKCFGFDPIFIPEGYTQTIAELGDGIKNKIGHRAKAMLDIYKQLML